jgi:nucleoside-diphosphate kinase
MDAMCQKIHSPFYVKNVSVYSQMDIFVFAKPNAIVQGHVGTILSAYEAAGWQLVNTLMKIPEKELCEKHYEEHKGKSFFDDLIQFTTSGPIVAFAFSRSDVYTPEDQEERVHEARRIMYDIRTNLGASAESGPRNFVHCSDSVESAKREIALWFC